MRIRLHEPTIINGHRHARGDIVEIPDGSKGPHRAMRKSADKIDYSTDPPIDANHVTGEFEDVPLYDIIPNEEEVGTKS
jgi:hypothetical protein